MSDTYLYALFTLLILNILAPIVTVVVSYWKAKTALVEAQAAVVREAKATAEGIERAAHEAKDAATDAATKVEVVKDTLKATTEELKSHNRFLVNQAVVNRDGIEHLKQDVQAVKEEVQVVKSASDSGMMHLPKKPTDPEMPCP